MKIKVSVTLEADLLAKVDAMGELEGRSRSEVLESLCLDHPRVRRWTEATQLWKVVNRAVGPLSAVLEMMRRTYDRSVIEDELAEVTVSMNAALYERWELEVMQGSGGYKQDEREG